MWETLKNKQRAEIFKNTEGDEAIRNSEIEVNELKRFVEFSTAQKKFNAFMSPDTADNQQENNNILDWYHFDTFDWWINRKPHLRMVVEEVKSLNNRFHEIIDSYLKANPAKVKELQIKLNDWINYWMVIDDKNSPTGRRTIHPIDVEILKRVLQWTGMELIDNWEASKRRYTIKEDWMLGPQTFAAICCFKKEYRNTSTTNTNRGTRQ